MKGHPEAPHAAIIDGTSKRSRRLLALSTLAVAFLFAAVATSPAQAAPGYQQTGEFGTTEEFPALSGVFSTGPRVAVDDVTSDVLAAYVGGNGALPGVYLFGSDGTLLEQIGSGSINPGGIAVDQTDGDLYVGDMSSGRIVRYTTDRANPPTYTLDTTYDGPGGGLNYSAGQIGSFLSALAVDPTNRDLLVADSGGLQIDRYEPDGSFLGAFDGAGTEAGRFTSLVDMVVSPGGQIYVVQNGIDEKESNNGTYKGPIVGSVVARYAANGAVGTVLAAGPALSEARAVGVDPTTGRVVVATGGSEKGSSPTISTPLALTVFAPSGAVESIARYVEPGTKSVTGGVAISATTGTLFSPTASNFSGGTSSVRRFTALQVPGTSVGVPAGLTPFAGRAQGVVTPIGKATTYYFEYKADSSSDWTSTASAEVPIGADPVSVEADLSLEPATEYEIRLVAEDADGRNETPTLLFASPPAAPVVVTGASIEVGAESAHVEGTINAMGSQTTYRFEYGPTSAYGSSVPAVPGVAGAGRSPVSVATELTGLQPSVIYHYRLVAKSAGGTTAGEDRTFETQASGTPGRAFELVSPLAKGNVGVELNPYAAIAGSDGNAMLFSTNKVSYPGSESTPYLPRVSAIRTAFGWQDRLPDPPAYNELIGPTLAFGTLAVSADQTKALVVSRAALAPGAVSGDSNLYIRDLQTNAFTLVATGALGGGGGGGDAMVGLYGENAVLGASSDLSTVVFAGGINVRGPGYTHPEGLAKENIYQWSESGGVTLVNVLPDGTPTTGSPEQLNLNLRDPNQVSTDGKRVYFSIFPGSTSEGLYLREGGQTFPVSSSHLPGEEGTVVGAFFLEASADGRYAVFTTGQGEAKPLTADAPPQGPESVHAVYRYDAVTKQLTYLAHHAMVAAVDPTTGDLYAESSVDRHLFHVRDGIETTIGQVTGQFIEEANSSPDGRYFVFRSGDKFTGYENRNFPELYLYDSLTNSLTCPSCRTDGNAPTGAVGIGFIKEAGGRSGMQRHAPRMVFDNGTVFFDTPDPLVPRDVNGERDVYEYRNGRTTLISDGSQPGESEFADSSADGTNVFFSSNQQLVAADVDRIFDMYDARVGGGFPTPQGGDSDSCGARCAGGAATPPPSANGSEAVAGSSRSIRPRRKRPPDRCPRKSTKRKSNKASFPACPKPGKHGRKPHGKGARDKSHATKGAAR